MSSEVRVHGLENEPAQLLTSPGFRQAESSIEQIRLKISVIFLSSGPMYTARFVCSTCVALKRV